VFLRKRPSEQDVAAFLVRARESRLTYEPVGLSQLSPPGYKIDEHRVRIGAGKETLELAKAALDAWAPFHLAWVEFHPSRPKPEVGCDVAIAVRHVGFWSLNACRVVGRFPVDAGDGRHGFFYGTLEEHAESGEELFAVERDPSDDSVWYRIRAVSRPRAALAKFGYPVSRRLQQKFRDDSAKVMKRDVGNRND
jgi:uncharacterized protein (UPF0548 family)